MACLSESSVSCWRLCTVSLGRLRRPLYSLNFPSYSRNRSSKGSTHFTIVFDTMQLALAISVTGLRVEIIVTLRLYGQCCLRFCNYAPLPNHSAGASHYHQSTDSHLKPHQSTYTIQAQPIWNAYQWSRESRKPRSYVTNGQGLISDPSPNRSHSKSTNARLCTTSRTTRSQRGISNLTDPRRIRTTDGQLERWNSLDNIDMNRVIRGDQSLWGVWDNDIGQQ